MAGILQALAMKRKTMGVLDLISFGITPNTPNRKRLQWDTV